MIELLLRDGSIWSLDPPQARGAGLAPIYSELDFTLPGMAAELERYAADRCSTVTGWVRATGPLYREGYRSRLVRGAEVIAVAWVNGSPAKAGQWPDTNRTQAGHLSTVDTDSPLSRAKDTGEWAG